MSLIHYYLVKSSWQWVGVSNWVVPKVAKLATDSRLPANFPTSREAKSISRLFATGHCCIIVPFHTVKYIYFGFGAKKLVFPPKHANYVCISFMIFHEIANFVNKNYNYFAKLPTLWIKMTIKQLREWFWQLQLLDGCPFSRSRLTVFWRRTTLTDIYKVNYLNVTA